MTHTVTRRGFLKTAALAAAGTAGAPHLLAHEPEPRPVGVPARSKVVLIRDPKVLDEKGVLNLAVASRMVDEALCALLGTRTAEEAWKQCFGPKDKVGIKTNVYAYLRTPEALEGALKKRIAGCGVSEKDIPVTDREAFQLFGDRTALLNIRPVRNHHWSGIGGCIKNYITTAPPAQWASYHPDSCLSLGAVWQLPIVKDKTRLNILLALNPLFYGRGPHNFDPRYQWAYGGIFVSKDPVALDALGAELLRLKRVEHFGEDRPVTPTKHIQAAETKYGLGVSDLARIDLLKLGSKDDILL